jgi:ATP-dependent NAD(P)H-hydrate dehydratase
MMPGKYINYRKHYFSTTKVISSTKIFLRLPSAFYYFLFLLSLLISFYKSNPNPFTVCAFSPICSPQHNQSKSLLPRSSLSLTNDKDIISMTMKLPNVTNLLQLTKLDKISYAQILARTVPTLSSKSHKGSSGRLLILGGSAKYTGAPYYAAMSALRTGSDLVTILCANEATMPLKSYSPELMVEGVYSASEFDDLVQRHNQHDCCQDDILINEKVKDMVQKVTDNFSRMHAIVIGPGLGRCPIVLKATAIIIQNAIKANLNIVLDADGLYLLSLEENVNIFQNYIEIPKQNDDNDNDGNNRSRIVLTPNVVEYKRLIDSIGNGSEEVLRKRLEGITVIQKGYEDVIEVMPIEDCNQTNVVSRSKMMCKEEGGLKRSGGIGKFK